MKRTSQSLSGDEKHHALLPDSTAYSILMWYCSSSGRDDSYSWAIAHEDGVELEVDDHGDLEDAAAVLVFSDELLAVMKGFGLDILTLFSGCPELNGAWSVVDILAHTYDIVKELLAIELGILTEGFIDGLNGYNSVKSQVIQDQVFLH